MNENTPLPEITVKAVILGIILSVVLSAANAYMGLLVGLTISASIPAAVLSMAILKMFKTSNILENNIVQTSASAGESLAAGVIFTIPALLILGYWKEFDYLQTTMIACLGGVMGVLFTIPLRRALIIEENLQFPEGVATAEVLKAGDEGGDSVKYMIISSLIGASYKFGDSGLKLWEGSIGYAKQIGSSVFAFASVLSPALLSVGYIVGLNVASLIFLGGLLNWFIAIPVFLHLNPFDNVDGLKEAAIAGTIWSKHTRYLGVGAMAVGGLWALINLISPIMKGIKTSIGALKNKSDDVEVPLTERDTPITWVAAGLVLCLIPLFGLYYHVIQAPLPSIIMSVVMLIAGFLFSAVAAYMAGLVGSSNNPISGVTIATILFASIMLSYIITDSATGPAAAIFIGAVVCCAAAIGGDNLQDLKAGQIVGATPWKQQVMQMIGVVSASLVIAPVLNLLNGAYGIGIKTALHPKPLEAAQANLMAGVAKGVFEKNLPWGLVGIGAIIALVVIILDKIQEARKSSFRLPVLAVAVGIYLPLEYTTPIFIGGLIATLANKYIAASKDEKEISAAKTRGLLFASGLITGEALIGILIAVPIVIWKNPNVLAINMQPLGGKHALPGLIILSIILYLLFKAATPKKSND